MQREEMDLTAVLRLADRRFRSVAPGDIHEMCAVVRRAAAALAPINTFYVGIYRGPSTLVMPYIVSDDEELGADTSEFGQHGLSHWIRSSARPYRFAQDDGRLCRRAVPLGDGTPSRDIVAVPMFDSDERVIGMLNAQSMEPDVFDDQFIVAFEWLATALAVWLDIGSEPIPRERLYQDHPELDSSRAVTTVDLFLAATERLEEITQIIRDLRNQLPSLDTDALREGLDDAGNACRRTSAELAVMVARSPDEQPDPAQSAALTSREREIAELIATESMTNAALARRLMISEATVKAHVRNILRKLGIHQRAELTWVLGPKSDLRSPSSTGS